MLSTSGELIDDKPVLNYILVTVAVMLVPIACCGLFAFGRWSGRYISPSPEHYTLANLNLARGQLDNLVKEEVVRAQQVGRRPYLYIYDESCRSCSPSIDSYFVDGYFKDGGRLMRSLDGVYLIRIDATFRPTDLQLMGVDFSEIPVIYELDSNGNLTGRYVDSANWDNYPTYESLAVAFEAFFQGKGE